MCDRWQGDQREDHDSGRAVGADVLSELGVLYYHCPDVSSVDKIATERSYRNRDEITVSPEKMGAIYEEKVRMFFNEHLHEDEEIRYILDGEGFFDVRNAKDDWIRISLVKGDLIVLPAGIYHRFTTDSKNVWCTHTVLHTLILIAQQYIKAMRLFKDEPQWTPLNRGLETDNNLHRKSYLHMRDTKSATSSNGKLNYN